MLVTSQHVAFKMKRISAYIKVEDCLCGDLDEEGFDALESLVFKTVLASM